MENLRAFIAAAILDLAFKKVQYDESLVKSKLLDSITVVELIVLVEEETGKKIPQHLITEDNLDTINSIVAIVESL